MGNDIKLTIGIPTYNGAKTIAETINSIIGQLTYDNSNKIEILISDNASNDNLEKIIENYVQRYPDLFSYYRNSENLGFDKNVDLVFKRAKGYYVWVFGDDDSFNYSAINYILDILETYPSIKVIFSNYEVCDARLVKKEIRGLKDIKEDIYCKDGDNFFQKGQFLFGLISSVIINKDEWNKIKDEKFSYYLWAYVFSMIKILAIDGESYIVAKKLFNLRTGQKRWESDGSSLKILLGILDVFNNMKRLGYQDKTYHHLVSEVFQYNLLWIINAKIRGFKNSKIIYKHMIKFFKRYPFFWLIHLPVLFMPNLILIGLNNTRKWLKGIY